MSNTSFLFTKMHALGNDFVIINALSKPLYWDHHFIQQLADRHTGIGFDQLLIIEPARQGDYFCQIFNADGSEAKQCGNGLRCIARLLHQEKIHPQQSMVLQTSAGLFPIFIRDYDHIQVNMGPPTILEHLMTLSLSPFQDLTLSIISTGNFHAVTTVNSVDNMNVEKLGHEISSHPFFTNGVNVGFVQIVDPSHIRLRTYERGVGETHACGSNACAASIAGIVNQWLASPINVEYRHGHLKVEWAGGESPIYLTGPATFTFTGQWI